MEQQTQTRDGEMFNLAIKSSSHFILIVPSRPASMLPLLPLADGYSAILCSSSVKCCVAKDYFVCLNKFRTRLKFFPSF